jgi:hypothetical protein
MPSEQGRRNPVISMSSNKMSSPRFYWLYTFDVMHTCVKKMNEKKEKKTNGKERRQ